MQGTENNRKLWITIAVLAGLVIYLSLTNFKLSKSVQLFEEETTDKGLVLNQDGISVGKEPVEPANLEKDDGQDDSQGESEQSNVADVSKYLMSRLVEHGAITNSVEEYEARFESEPIDPQWGAQRETLLETELANNQAFATYGLSNLECRSSLCRADVWTHDGQPFDNYGASIAVVMSELESAKLATLQIESRDAPSARVFFERINSED